jgi:hypothetical protein
MPEKSRRVIIERGADMVSIIAGIAFVSLGASCAAIGSFLVHREIAAVNRRVPDAEQTSYSFMYPGKMRKIKAEYKRLYPTGKIETWRLRLQIAMFAFLAVAAIFLGFFR